MFKFLRKLLFPVREEKFEIENTVNCISCKYFVKKSGGFEMSLPPDERQKIIDSNLDFLTNSNVKWEVTCHKGHYQNEDVAKLWEDSIKVVRNNCEFKQYVTGEKLD